MDDYSSRNYRLKSKLIKNDLKNIKSKKGIHYKKFSKLKKVCTIVKTIINLFNSISVCSLVLSFQTSDIVIILALTSTSLSSLLSAVLQTTELDNKIHSHHTSYLQYSDVYREVNARLKKNGLSSNDLDIMLSEMNTRLGLIEDNSLPVSISVENIEEEASPKMEQRPLSGRVSKLPEVMPTKIPRTIETTP